MNTLHHFDEENMTNIISPTLSILLAFIDNSLDENSLPSIMIGNIFTNKVTKTYSTLQIALALSTYRKELINTLYNFGVTYSYDEYLRYTTCAGVANYKCNNLVSQLKAENGLIQLLVDNYDQALSSMNCSKTGTHALGMVITQMFLLTVSQRLGRTHLSLSFHVRRQQIY